MAKNSDMTCPICRQSLNLEDTFLKQSWILLDCADVKDKLENELTEALSYLAQLPSSEGLRAYYQPVTKSVQGALMY